MDAEITKANAETITRAYSASVTNDGLAALKKQVEIERDLAMPGALGELKKDLASVRKIRTSVEKTRKELKADALQYGRMVDNEAKRIISALLEIEDPLKDQKEKYEEQKRIEKEAELQKERDRIAAIEERIASIERLPLSMISASATELGLQIDELKNTPDDFNYEELTQRRNHIIRQTFGTLKTMRANATMREDAEELRTKNDRLAREAAKEEAEALAKKVFEAQEVARIEREKLARQREEFERERRIETERQSRAAEEERERQATERAEIDKARMKLVDAQAKIDAENVRRERIAKHEQLEKTAAAKEDRECGQEPESEPIADDDKTEQGAASATWAIHLFSTCPHCDEDVDLLDESDFWETHQNLKPCEHPGRIYVECPECSEKFAADLKNVQR